MTRQDSAGTGTARDGALAGYLVGFGEELSRCGYGPVRLGAHLELFADLCRWMEREGVGLPELGSNRVAAFLDDRRRRGRTDLVSGTGARPLVSYLIRAGAIPGQGFVVPEGPARAVLERYRRYLETERGLTAQTVERYVGLAGRFAAALERGGAIGWHRVRPGMSRGFCWATARHGVAGTPRTPFPPCGRSCGSATWRASSRSGSMAPCRRWPGSG